jgi:hypothetical protein
MHVLEMHDQTNRNHNSRDDASQDTHESLLDSGPSGTLCSCQILAYILGKLSLCTTIAADHQTVYGNVALFVPVTPKKILERGSGVDQNLTF